MNIGIISIVKVNNYGAELQAYALQKKLSDIGFNAEIIDYLFYKHKNYIHTMTSHPFVQLGFKRKLKEKIYPVIEKICSLSYREAKIIREEKFESFHRRNTRFSSIQYTSIDLLYNTKMNYDVFIVGSDQVWNPYTNTSLMPYFLTFAPNDKKKLSYASSFGVSSIPDHAKKTYRECLNNLDYISVREKQGCQIVKELTGRDAYHVLDPTLLLDKREWQGVAVLPSQKKPYILLYVLIKSPYITHLAKFLSVEFDMNLVRICKNAIIEDRDNSIVNIIDAGPSEFIGWLLNASFILTNSFHGTAFSVNFNKPFYTILPKHKPNNSRLQDFLSSLKLDDRLLLEGAVFPEKSKPILDFMEANQLLNMQKIQSINYLLQAINGTIQQETSSV
jgi:hypothetical protein